MAEEGKPDSVLAGVRLLPRDVADLCFRAGWHGHVQLYTMVAIVYGESAGYTEAVGPKNADGTQDYGLFQINSGHHGWSQAMAFDPERAKDFAYMLYQEAGYSFVPWVAGPDGNGSYRRHLQKSINGCCNFSKLVEGLPLQH